MSFDAGSEVGTLRLHEFTSCDMLVKLDVAVRHAFHKLGSHLRHNLSLFPHEVMVDEPLAHKLLAELALRLAFLETLLITFGIEIARRVGGVNLVDEYHLAVAFAELIFCIDEYQPFLLSHLGAEGEELAGVVFHHLVVFLAHESLCDDFLAGDVFVMAFSRLCGGG